MSRHTVEAREPERYEIVVGFDPPLDTFFGQVIDRETRATVEHRQERREQLYRDALASGVEPEPDDDESTDEDYFTLWVGTSVGEVLTVEALADALAPFATLTPELRETLRNDCAREARPPTEHQLLIRSFLDGITKKRS